MDVGTPPEGYKEWTTAALVRFHGFANLTTTRGEYVLSPEFSCFGHQWRLKLYPGGHTVSDEGYVGVSLRNSRSDTSIKIKYCLSVRDEDDDEVVQYKPEAREFGVPGSGYSARCHHNFAKHSTIMESLLQGSFVIEVRMKLIDTSSSITQFIPTNPIHKNVMDKFMDEESADVVFEVVDNGSLQSDEEHNNKKTKTTTLVYAHRFILQDISTMLAELCKSGEGGVTTISITDVKPDTFKHMLYYTYGRWEVNYQKMS